MVEFAALAVLALILWAIWRKLRNNPETDDEVIDVWSIEVQNGDGSAETIDTFPISRLESLQLSWCSREELEDEAAGYACFCSSLVHDLRADTVFTVKSDMFGTYKFVPDYEDDQMIGVKSYMV